MEKDLEKAHRYYCQAAQDKFNLTAQAKVGHVLLVRHICFRRCVSHLLPTRHLERQFLLRPSCTSERLRRRANTKQRSTSAFAMRSVGAEWMESSPHSGVYIQTGNGVVESAKQAFKFYRLAAKAGVADGNYRLGKCYEVVSLGVRSTSKYHVCLVT